MAENCFFMRLQIILQNENLAHLVFSSTKD